MKKFVLSIVIPVYNRGHNIVGSYLQLKTKLKELVKDNIGGSETIFVDNNSGDETYKRLKEISGGDHSVTALRTEIRGIGLALKNGLENAKGDYVYFTAIDHPFNFRDLDSFLKIIDKYDLIYASKNNSKSVYKAPFKRKIASIILSSIVKILFNLPLTDTQGTFMIKKDALINILPFCNSPGPFFQAQLAVNAKRLGYKIGEIPVNYISKSGSSSFSLFHDGLLYVREAISEKF